MADKKISQLTALSAANVASATDVLAIVDTSATETKKITAKDLIDGALNGGTANGVLYLNGSKVATSGSALTFNGTLLTNRPTSDSNTNIARFGVINSAGTDDAFLNISADAANNLVTLDSTGNNTGAFAFSTGGGEKMRLTSSVLSTDSSISVGIGTASPGTKLDVNGDIRASNEIYLDNGKYLRFKRNSGGLSIQTLGIESGTDNVRLLTTGAFNIVNGSLSNMLTLDASGNLGVGTTSPSQKLDVTGGARFYSAGNWMQFGVNALESLNNDGGYIRAVISTASNPTYAWQGDQNTGIFTPAADTIGVTTGGTERGRFTAGGYFKASSNGTYVGSTGAYHELVQTIGATTAVEILWNTATSGNNVFLSFQTDANLERGTIDYNRAGGLTRYNTTSDYRAKDVYGLLNDSGQTIDALKVYRGKMHGATMERPMLIAHEAQEVAPYAVTGEKDAVNEDGTPKFQQMDTSSLVPLLIAEIQSLRSRVAALEAK